MGISQGSALSRPGPQFFQDWTDGRDYATGYFYAEAKPGLVVSNSVVAGNGIINLAPFTCRRTHTFQTIGFYNSSAAQAGRKFRMGIYGSVNGIPSGAPLVDGGETTLGAAAAFNEKTVNQTLVEGKLYYLALTTDGTLTGQALTPTTGYLPGMSHGVVNVVTIAGLGPTALSYGFSMANTYGALPTIGTLIDGYVATSPALLWLKG